MKLLHYFSFDLSNFIVTKLHFSLGFWETSILSFACSKMSLLPFWCGRVSISILREAHFPIWDGYLVFYEHYSIAVGVSWVSFVYSICQKSFWAQRIQCFLCSIFLWHSIVGHPRTLQFDIFLLLRQKQNSAFCFCPSPRYLLGSSDNHAVDPGCHCTQHTSSHPANEPDLAPLLILKTEPQTFMNWIWPTSTIHYFQSPILSFQMLVSSFVGVDAYR